MMKLAIFRSEGAHPTQIYYDGEGARYTGWTRVTEWVDVEFPPPDEREIAAERIKRIDKQIESMGADFGGKLQDLQAVRAQLASLVETRQ